MNRQVHLAVALPERAVAITDHGEAEAGIASLIGLLSGFAVEAWKAEHGLIHGLSVRVNDDSASKCDGPLPFPLPAPLPVVLDIYQDRHDLWTKNGSVCKRHSFIEIYLHELHGSAVDGNTGGESFRTLVIEQRIDGRIDFRTRPQSGCRLIFDSMGERHWDWVVTAQIAPLEEEGLDRSHELDSVDAVRRAAWAVMDPGMILTEEEQRRWDEQIAQADLDTMFCLCGKRRLWHLGFGGLGLCHGAVAGTPNGNATGGFQARTKDPWTVRTKGELAIDPAPVLETTTGSTLLDLAGAERAAAAVFEQHAVGCQICRPPEVMETATLCQTGQDLVKARNDLTDALLMSHAFPQRGGDS